MLSNLKKNILRVNKLRMQFKIQKFFFSKKLLSRKLKEKNKIKCIIKNYLINLNIYFFIKATVLFLNKI